MKTKLDLNIDSLNERIAIVKYEIKQIPKIIY